MLSDKNVADEMAQFGKYQFRAGKFAGFKTSRHTEQNGIAHNPGRRTR